MKRMRFAGSMLAVAIAAPVAAQGIAARVGSAPDGSVRITFAARAGVCGDGRSFIAEPFGSPDGVTIYSTDGMSDYVNIGGGPGSFGGMKNCAAGPVRVMLSVANHRVIDVRPYVGPATSRTTGADTDAGTVSAPAAADYLLSIAATADEHASRGAMLSASLADSAHISARLAQMARDKALRSGVRENALRWLARAGEREDDRQADQVARTIAADESDVTAVRERALRTIRHTTENDSWLRTQYARFTETSLKERTLRVLAEGGGTTNSAWVTNIALNEGEPLALRERALRLLGDEMGSPTEMRQLYEKVSEPSLRERILRIAGESGDAVSLRWLHSIAEDATASMSLRDRAIRILGESGESAQTAYLRGLYAQVSDATLRDRILRTASEGGGEENQRWLRQIAENEKEDSSLRDRAVRTLSETGIATSALVAMYDAINDRPVRERLISIFGERADRAGSDKLAAIAKGDADYDLRRRAARRLAEAGDPRAKQLLEDTKR